MDSQSAVEYWEKFSIHAFDNTDKSCVYSCIIQTPQQKPVPCTFCFTIKRDIFDLPSVIVGNVSSVAGVMCTIMFLFVSSSCLFLVNTFALKI